MSDKISKPQNSNILQLPKIELSNIAYSDGVVAG
jgi:hypothetical protein